MPIKYKVVADAVGSTNNEEDGDNRNEEVKNDGKWEGKALHSGEWPGYREVFGGRNFFTL